ncbi:hypothetical protein ABF162_25630 (plasmid) [Vibrio coralliilyticus]|uniref:hypothetical protein n=1 Tax=Vibrio coralliilyticus TaxID=190893 RepID=UPI001184797F|nr:hypothetical protein [Vibrio coralliilyticus]
MDKHAPKSVSSPTLEHAAPTRQFSIMDPHWLAQHSASMDPVSTQQALTLFIAELTSYQPLFENTHYTTTELRALPDTQGQRRQFRSVSPPRGRHSIPCAPRQWPLAQ